jgi:S-ribosylhomocysteine lyase
MDRIPSFSKNHDTLSVGLYKSMEMRGVTTWDLRFKKPNAGDYITPKSLHTIEHVIATVLRNSAKKDDIIYFGPMGCRTGFYLLTTNMGYDEVLPLLIEAFKEGKDIDYIPGNKREECGNYLEHDLAQAKKDMQEYLDILLQL